MNYKNFENASHNENDNRQEKFLDGVPGSGKSFRAKPADISSELEDEIEAFYEISEILARQEYRKRRFYRNLKKAIIAIFSIFVFSGIFIFAKRSKTGKSEKSKKQ